MEWGTVEQENFTTGKFREFVASGGSRQENFVNLWLEEFLMQVILACTKISRISQKSRNFPAREIFLFYSI